jgi:hypothetical protein
MTLTTGISMIGKMSLGVVTIADIPKMNTRREATTNVYGLRRARRTIHILSFPTTKAELLKAFLERYASVTPVSFMKFRNYTASGQETGGLGRANWRLR